MDNNLLERFKVIHGEAVETMEDMVTTSVDLVLTDPPFNHDTEHYITRKVEYKKASKSLADIAIMNQYFTAFAKQARRLVKPTGRVLLFCDPYSYPLFYFIFRPHFDHTRALIWYKGENYYSLGTNQAFRYSYEMILHAWDNSSLFSMKQRQDVIKLKVEPSQKRLHPAQKPTELLRLLIEATTQPDDLVLDSYAGSGSVLEACLQTGRRNISIEANEKLIDIIGKRASLTAVQNTLLG